MDTTDHNDWSQTAMVELSLANVNNAIQRRAFRAVGDSVCVSQGMFVLSSTFSVFCSVRIYNCPPVTRF